MRAYVFYDATVGEVALVAAQTLPEARTMLALETGWADYAADAVVGTILDGEGGSSTPNVRREAIPDATKLGVHYPIGFLSIAAA